MNTLDSRIDIVLEIADINSKYTVLPIEVLWLSKKIEVKIPNNVKKGDKIRLKGLGYKDFYGNQGDLYLFISKIIINDSTEITNTEEKVLMQKILVVEHNDFSEVNKYLADGWNVKEFKPYNGEKQLYDGKYLYVYVLLEKQTM